MSLPATARPLPTAIPLTASKAAPALTSAPADDAALEGDALPAVGKVWDSSPRRSLSSMFASGQRKEPPSAAGGMGIAPELVATWSALIAAVKEKLGQSIAVPLVSGAPRREGGTLVVRLTGVFARLSPPVTAQLPQIQRLLQSVAPGLQEIRLEIDESVLAVSADPGRATAGPSVPAPKEGIPITPELRKELEKDPLIRALIQQMNGVIVRVE